jgi:PAS domain S-box-containing protein
LKVNALTQTWNQKAALLVICEDKTAQRDAEERLFQINASLEELVKERTEKLKLSELNFINLFEKSNDSVIINDFEGNIVNANQVASDMLGYPREELLKMKTDQIVYRNAYGHVPLREKIKNNTNFIYQLENITAEGKRIPVEVRSTVVDYF